MTNSLLKFTFKLLVLVTLFSVNVSCGAEESVAELSLCQKMCRQYCSAKIYCKQSSRTLSACQNNCFDNVSSLEQAKRDEYCQNNFELLALEKSEIYSKNDPDIKSPESKAFCSSLNAQK